MLNVLYVPVEGGRIHAIDRISGKRVWVYSSGADRLSTPTLVEDKLLITDSKGNLRALDKNTGQELWSMPIAESITSVPVLADGTLYLASKDGNLYAVE